MNLNNDFDIQLNRTEDFVFCGNFNQEIEVYDLQTGSLKSKSKPILSSSSLHSFCYDDHFRVVNNRENFNDFYDCDDGFWISTPQPNNPLHVSFFPINELFIN